jgi:hypothetical protein
MYQHDLAPWRAVGPFGFDKYLHIRFRVVQLLLNGLPPRAGWPEPEVPGDSLHMRILE